MIDKTIKNIKKYFKTLKGILTAKISEKKYFTRFGGDTYSKNSSIKKRLDIKHGLNIN